nr:myb-like protein X [Helicoverpa armigera]
MKYVILHYFFIAHLCNMKMLANTMRHKSSRETYDIDGFIHQLLASRKFDELAEKVADKAAVRIMHIETSPARLQRFTKEVNKINKTIENPQKSHREPPSRDHEIAMKADSSDDIKLRNDNSQDKQGMIDTQAVMMDENTSQSNSLKLKYKYLTRNAYEKKLFSDRGSEKTDQPKRNEVSAEKSRDHDKKAEEHTHQDNSEKKQHSSSKTERETSKDDNSRWRHDNRDNDREDSDSKKQDKSHVKSHDNMDTERKENNKNNHQREDQEVRRDTIDTQNSRPEFKSIVKNEVHAIGHVDDRNSTEDENPESSSVENDDVKIVPPLIEKTSEEDEKGVGNLEKSSSDENIVKEKDEFSPVTLKSRDETEPNIDENKITADNQDDSIYVYRSEEHKEPVEEHNEKIEEHKEKIEEHKEKTEKHKEMAEKHKEKTKEHKGPVKEPKSEEQESVEQVTGEPKSEEPNSGERGNGEQKTEELKAEAQDTEEEPMSEQKAQENGDSNEEDRPTASNKPVIRREGNKVFTYVEAPEYQEYHEQMAKMQKEHPFNPTDFLP